MSHYPNWFFTKTEMCCYAKQAKLHFTQDFIQTLDKHTNLMAVR